MAEALAVVDTLDTIGARASSIPKGTKRVMVYITGSGGVPWTNAQIEALAAKGVQLVIRIDQSNRVLAISSAVLVKDVEPGASTNLTADHEAVLRAKLGLRTVLYCMLSDFESLRTSVASLGITGFVDYLVADWNLDRAGAIAFLEQHPECIGVQWASPTSNPQTLVPGSNQTLREANIDLSVTRADWPTPLPTKKRKKVPLPPVKIHPKITAAGISGALTTGLIAYLNSRGAHITHLDTAESSAISLAAAVLAGYFVPAKDTKN